MTLPVRQFLLTVKISPAKVWISEPIEAVWKPCEIPLSRPET